DINARSGPKHVADVTALRLLTEAFDREAVEQESIRASASTNGWSVERARSIDDCVSIRLPEANGVDVVAEITERIGRHFDRRLTIGSVSIQDGEVSPGNEEDLHLPGDIAAALQRHQDRVPLAIRHVGGFVLLDTDDVQVVMRSAQALSDLGKR